MVQGAYQAQNGGFWPGQWSKLAHVQAFWNGSGPVILALSDTL